jgi:RND family efflux transporter MFP subunit
VRVARAQTTALGEWTELLGTTLPLPDKVARVSAAVEGHVHSLPGKGATGISEGEQVKEGQVIARLDDRVARANRDKFAAQMGELAELKKQAQLAVDLADLEVKRLEELRRENTGTTALVSRIELERSRIALKDAQSKKQGVLAREDSLRAELKALETQLDYYTLRAPISGRLGQLQVTLGQTITPGTTVAEILDLEEIDILCVAPPDAARRLAVGQEARLLGERPSVSGPVSPMGKVVFLAVQAQPETGSFAVKVRFPNRELGLRANAVVRLKVETQPEKQRQMIPESALLEDQEPPAVVLATGVEEKTNAEGKKEKHGKALLAQATLGVRDREHGMVEILGLQRLKKEEEKKDEKEDKEEKKDAKEEKKDAKEEKKDEKIPLEGAQFAIKGAHGLHDGDALKVEEEEGHGKD